MTKKKIEDALLLQDAFFTFSTPETVEMYHTAIKCKKDYESSIDLEYMRQMERVFIYDNRFKKEVKRQFWALKKEFLQRLIDGTFTAWAREGSPLAPLQEIPASAWPLLRLRDVPNNIIKGPQGILYDVHIGDNKPHNVAPHVKKKGGRPSKVDVVMEEHKRRHAKGINEDSNRAEAFYLEKWFKENFPDKNPPHHRTIENNISGLVKENMNKNK